MHVAGLVLVALAGVSLSLAGASDPSFPTRRQFELAIEKRIASSGIQKRANNVTDSQLDACPGYVASNVKTNSYSITADLHIAGNPCNVYGPDLEQLRLQVTYESDSRIHIKITDAQSTRYEVPESVLPRPKSSNTPSLKAQIQFKYTTNPFTFSIVRSGPSNEVLFSTSADHPLIFEPQYLRLKTASLPPDANIYGLGEHTDTFRLPNNNFTRTFWSRDAYGVPAGTNLYGNHPIYFEHRKTGTHGVFLLNSNGMDIKINQESTQKTSLEYNVIGGVFDLYFIAGPSPIDVAKQYAQIVGTPAEVAYWSFGLHQCRYGYTDFVNVAEVVANYSRAGIPLETMWTDIDYMYKRWTFTNDPEYFPTAKMQELVSGLHERSQHYILMVDPAVAYQPDQGYTAYDQGVDDGVFLRTANGSWSIGVVWPGQVVYPDWFHPNSSSYWTNQFARFFNKDTGIDIDGVWIDMNEPSSFCTYPCDDPAGQAAAQGLPPPRTTSPPSNSTPIVLSKRAAAANESGLDLLSPPYSINIATTALSDRTAYTDIVHYGGVTEYDTHNLYGTMMSVKTHEAMLSRRENLRTIVITRSTFAGAGAKVGKWLGDNLSDWVHYKNSIAGMLGFASVYQVPMVGADICGFGGSTTEILCARWAMLGAFGPFYRNHNEVGNIDQEFYRWPLVTTAAKNAIEIRYRLIDYIYTAMHQAHLDGTPILNPLFYKYPQDENTYPIDTQFLFGDSVLVSPVVDENSTEVSIYLPKDTFYDYLTYAPVQGQGQSVHLTNISYTAIPLHIRGGAVLPLRASSANTTTELRTRDFELVVVPGSDGSASGKLYIDDGVSVVQSQPTTWATFTYSRGTLKASGTFASTNKVSLVSFLGVNSPPKSVRANGRSVASSDVRYDATTKVARATVSIPLTGPFTIIIS